MACFWRISFAVESRFDCRADGNLLLLLSLIMKTTLQSLTLTRDAKSCPERRREQFKHLLSSLDVVAVSFINIIASARQDFLHGSNYNYAISIELWNQLVREICINCKSKLQKFVFISWVFYQWACYRVAGKIFAASFSAWGRNKFLQYSHLHKICIVKENSVTVFPLICFRVSFTSMLLGQSEWIQWNRLTSFFPFAWLVRIQPGTSQDDFDFSFVFECVGRLKV